MATSQNASSSLEPGGKKMGTTMSGGAMAVIQNADLIEARLAVLAEGRTDGEDALNEQAFIEESQLIIAKVAFPASAGSQAWKDVTWVGKASQQIAAMLNRRLKGVEASLLRKLSAELRQSVSSELDDIRQRALAAEQAAESAISVKNTYLAKCAKLTEEVTMYKKELGDGFEQLLNSRIQAENAREELERYQRAAKRAQESQKSAENTAAELAQTLSELRKASQGLTAERNDLLRGKAALEEAVSKAKAENGRLHEELDSQRVALTNALHATRSEFEQALNSEAAEYEARLEKKEQEVQNLAASLEEQHVLELKMAAIEGNCHELQNELNTSREYVVALMEASARIGHFSMRTGGGYEHVGRAWEGLHRYIASTPWGKEAGLDKALRQESFSTVSDKKPRRFLISDDERKLMRTPGGQETVFPVFFPEFPEFPEKEKEKGKKESSRKVPGLRVSAGPVFSDGVGSWSAGRTLNNGPHHQPPQQRATAASTSTSPRTAGALGYFEGSDKMKELGARHISTRSPPSLSPRTPRAASPSATPRPTSARERVGATFTGTPRSVSISTPRTPRAKTPRFENSGREQNLLIRTDSVVYEASSPSERALSWRPSTPKGGVSRSEGGGARVTPRESRMRVPDSCLSVSQRLQECAESLKFERRKPPPKESREASRGRQEFSLRGAGSPGERDGDKNRPDLNKAWTGLLKSRDRDSAKETHRSGAGIMRASVRPSPTTSPERGAEQRGKWLSEDEHQRWPSERSIGKWLSGDEHQAPQEYEALLGGGTDTATPRNHNDSSDAALIAEQLDLLWVEYYPTGPEHASCISRVALPLIIKRLSAGATDGEAMQCAHTILEYCHADPDKVYKNEVAFALLKPHVRALLRPEPDSPRDG